MVFKELADLVLLNVNGGQFTSEAAVQRPEVNSYIPIAGHYALQEQAFRLKQDQRAERGATGFAGGSVVDGSYYTTYVLGTTLDQERNTRFIELPGVVQSVPGILALESVFPKDNPAGSFPIVTGPSATLGMGEVMPCCWHEIHGEKSRIYFDALSSDTCDLVVRACMEISSSLGEETLAIPRGFEQRIIAYCLDHFRPQRQSPADGLINNHDINAITANQPSQ
jgi:hypothetical protein